MAGHRNAPRISVVIPTYNRSGLLRKTLHQLTRQDLPVQDFEVIVADDGSSDDTKAVVEEFADTLQTAYHFQPDLGFRAGTARNSGAQLASGEVLVFLDTGAMAGPQFLRSHLAAHQDPDRSQVVLGYTYGYNPEEPMPGLAEVLDRYPPEQAVERFGEDPAFRDLRHEPLIACDYDLNRRTLPWSVTWTVNCSVRSEDFWGIGGFDETFVGWGAEDLEFGLRMYERGLGFQLNRDAWAIESPHIRNWGVMYPEFIDNMGHLLAKHRNPIMEIGLRLIVDMKSILLWEDCATELHAWTEQVRERDVREELRTALRDSDRHDRIAIIGCGAAAPEWLEQPAVLLDFDRQLLEQALADGRHTGEHTLGLRTSLPDHCVDTVVITSRLAGLRERWNDDLVIEAHRLGRRVIDASYA
jgi:glycosyltransferase involved in cell wall biosynthesis